MFRNLWVGGFLYAWFFAQGIPLWGKDPTSSLQGVLDRLSPWSYVLFRCLVFAGLGALIYLWARRLTEGMRRSELCSVAAAIFFLLSPGTIAALIPHQDFAPVTGLLFLALTYVLWTGFALRAEFRPRRLLFLAIPLALLLALAVPWRSGVIGFVWDGKMEVLRGVSALLGPFLLLPVFAFALWSARFSAPAEEAAGARWARWFVLIWLASSLVAVSALDPTHLHPMVPLSILLGWLLARLIGARAWLPRWASWVVILGFCLQAGINAQRSIAYRRSVGRAMVAVDQVHARVNRDFADAKLALLPDFDAAPVFLNSERLSSIEALTKHHEPGKTYVLSWKPSLWEQLEVVDRETGCREGSWFDRLFPCAPGSGAYLMRYIGADPLYKKAERLRARGAISKALAMQDRFLQRHPGSLAARFVSGLMAYRLKDWKRADSEFTELETWAPDHTAILYNHALALMQLGRYAESARRLQAIALRNPRNYAALLNLYLSYKNGGQPARAWATLLVMKWEFPKDPEVIRLLSL